jgi:N-methylhydantoinase A/oxoprolinase/acetone carboxylase beta subunit
MDIMHGYEASKKLTLMEPVTQTLSTEYETFNQTVEKLAEQAKRDLRGDGLELNDASYVLELDMLYGGQFHVKRALSPRLSLHGPEDVKAVCDAFQKEFSEAFSPFVVNPEGGVFIESFILKAIVPVRKIELPTLTLEGCDPAAAKKGERAAYWPERKDYVQTPVYAYESLRPGNMVSGPAIVEGEYTTLVVPLAMRFSIDQRNLGILQHDSDDSNRSHAK